MTIANMSADIGAELAARKRRRSTSGLNSAVIAADDRSGFHPGGEGITRCPTTAGRLWKVRVEFQFGGRPMLATVRAINEKQALTFTLARHPTAIRSSTAVLGPAS